MIIQVGLTGNMGSGKTTVAKVFETLNIPIFYADIEAKSLYQEDCVQKEVIKMFGDSVLRDNQLSIKMLSSLVFSDVNKLKQLTDLIHPLVKAKYQEWYKKFIDVPYVIMENAVLFEGGFDSYCDYIITVVATKKSRIERIQKRDKLNIEEIELRLSKQLNENTKISQSDFIIDNNENIPLLPQILKIHKHLSSIKP